MPPGLFLAAQALAFFAAGAYAQQQPSFAFAVADAFTTLRVLAGTDASDAEAPLSAPPPPSRTEDDRDCPREGRISLERFARLRAAMFKPGLRCQTRVPRAQTAAARFEFLDGTALSAPIIVQGGAEQFRDLCPDAGCLAVAFAATGAVLRAYPWRVEALPAANIVDAAAYPYGRPPGWSFAENMHPFGLDVYPNGDLLVVFRSHDAFPGGGGVARIAPDGQPRWYRQDFSHHWPSIGPGEVALVPGQRRGRTTPVKYAVRNRTVELPCPPERLIDDYVTLIDGHGQLLQELSVLDAIATSAYNVLLVHSHDPCDPTHLNFAHRLGPDAGGASDLQPGDVVVSLRNLDAFAILARDDYRLKRIVRGSFIGQHGVQHLTRAQFLLFDNLGTDGRLIPPRLLRVDLATGEETILFPTDATPAFLRPNTAFEGGQIDISPDRCCVLFTDVGNRRGLEIRLADGQVRALFYNLHALAPLAHASAPPSVTDMAWYFQLRTIAYAPAAGDATAGNRRVPGLRP